MHKIIRTFMNRIKSSDDLEGFARDFKQRRIKLGYTQVKIHFISVTTYISFKWAYFWILRILRFLIKRFKIFSIRFRRSGLYRRRTKEPFFHNGKIFHLCAKMRVSSTDRDIYSVLFRIKKNPPMVNYDMKILKVSEMDVRKFTKIFNF